MKRNQVGDLVDNKNKIGFSRWILSYKEYSKELINYREDFDKIEADFNNREDNLKKEITKLNNLLEEKKEELAKSVENVIFKSKKIQELEDINNKLITDYQAINSLLEESNSTNIKLKEEISTKNNLISKYLKDNEKLKKELKDFKKEFVKQSQTILDNTNSLNSRNKEIEKLHKELSDQVLEIERLKGANKQLIENKPKKSRKAYLTNQKVVEKVKA